MPLSRKELETLLQLVARTKDAELNCEQCLALVAEFAERQLEGQSVTDSLAAVEQHLSICAECRDEYAALRQALEEMDE